MPWLLWSCSSGPGDRTGLHQPVLRDAVLVRRTGHAAAAGGQSLISLVLAGSTGLWTAWFLILLAIVWFTSLRVVEGVALVLANVMMGVAAAPVGQAQAESAGPAAGLPGSIARDPKASGYHIAQSKIAIGSGGWSGKGFTAGSRSVSLSTRATHRLHLRRGGEELGFLGVTVALTVPVPFPAGDRVATRASDSFQQPGGVRPGRQLVRARDREHPR